MSNIYYVYILGCSHGTFYIGVTNDVIRRVTEHRQGIGSAFTNKYSVHRLLYVEEYEDVQDALAREKQLKGWSRTKKTELISRSNPRFSDLFDEEFS
jgi:putative endonuclease